MRIDLQTHGPHPEMKFWMRFVCEFTASAPTHMPGELT